MELMCSKIEMDDHNIKIRNIMMVKIDDINHNSYKILLEKINIFLCTSTKIKTFNINKSYNNNYCFIFL